MKKFLLLFFLTFSVFSLAGCGNDETPEEEEKIEDIEEEDEIGDGEVDDEQPFTGDFLKKYKAA